jgi:hypothetical protein
MVCGGAKVMQFLEHGKYIAVAADGKVRSYPAKNKTRHE